MKASELYILESDNNKKGDLFGRLMGDLFHALGYDEPRFNIHKSGRELDLQAKHRTEQKYVIAECKAHKQPIGGDDLNKFAGVLEVEKSKLKKDVGKRNNIVGYYVSMSGYTETAIEQENETNNLRMVLMKPDKIIKELIQGRIVVPIEKAVSKIFTNFELLDESQLLGTNYGWIWVLYYTNNKLSKTHFALIHAEGEPLLENLSSEIINLDKISAQRFCGLSYIVPPTKSVSQSFDLESAQNQYFNYLRNECGEIQFEGLPTDKDAGSVKVQLENILVPLHLTEIETSPENLFNSNVLREPIGSILQSNHRLAILAKPGGGKSTLIKSIAIAYAFPNRRDQVDDNLPDRNWFPVFIRCRELGDKVNLSITEIINYIPIRAEIPSQIEHFKMLISDALQKGSALLLIDGLDEIADDRSRIKFVSQLRTFIGTYPNINVIVTSREAGFRIVGGSLATYCKHYRVSGLSDSDIEELCIKWHKAIIDHSDNTIKEANSVSSLILKDTRIKAIAQNPLLLTTLLFVKRWAGYLPTKRTVLYQEMIKLLLVTWNVEGHEQLDIDEAEPQLAYVAFNMSLSGVQTITEDRLKRLLELSRIEMPEILDYTNISVSNFIKRVESRSSLLIMSGHKRITSGEIVPVYEFLHLSFQEYLTAKAIVKKFIQADLNNHSPLDILTPHILKENWKEIIPIVAVLLERNSKNLVTYLIKKSKEIAEDEHSYKNYENRTIPELLGNCIANEIQISPDLLTEAIEWFVKNRYNILDDSICENILYSKFSRSFKEITRKILFNTFDDNFFAELGSVSADIYKHVNKEETSDEYLRKILADMQSSNIESVTESTLAMMVHFFKQSLGSDDDDVQLPAKFTLIKILSKNLNSENMHIFTASVWCLCWYDSRKLSDDFRDEIVNKLIANWVTIETYNLSRFIAWSITNLITPEVIISFKNLEKLREHVLTSYQKSRNESEKLCSIYVGYLLKIQWDIDELTEYFNQPANEDKWLSKKDISFNKFANRLNIKRIVREQKPSEFDQLDLSNIQ